MGMRAAHPVDRAAFHLTYTQLRSTSPKNKQLYRSESLEDGIGKTFPVFTAIITVNKGVVTVGARRNPTPHKNTSLFCFC